MPTGYTADVQSGKIATFPEFAMQCARAFGALITMRDDPSDAKIPDRFEADTSYYDEKIAAARSSLDEIQLLSDAECERRATESNTDAMKRHEDWLAEKRLHRKRYNDMRALVSAWTPPSPDHAGLKTFMLEQLDSSIDFDCSEVHMEPPVTLSGEEWRKQEIKRATRDLEYSLKHHREEVEQTQERNRWIRLLRESL